MTHPRDGAYLIANGRAARRAYGAAERSVVNHEGYRHALRVISGWPGYEPTPLVSLPGIAAGAAVDRLWYKDEATRFGLGSFKALGGPYGVLRAIGEELRRSRGFEDVTGEMLLRGRFRDNVSLLTVATATDGNHGRSVAWGAQLVGCRSHIYLPAAVSHAREAAIASYGADITRVDGDYDDAVHRVRDEAARRGYLVVSDTSYPGYADIPRHIMQGYAVLAGEIVEQLPEGARPTHLFLQGGVGAFAASVCAHLWEAWGRGRPVFVVVEPERADCLFQTAARGRPTKVPGPHHTIMAGLAAGEVSQLGWRILDKVADYFMVIPDSAAAAAMRLLAGDTTGGPKIVAGESGVAGLAGFLRVCADREVRDLLELDESARVLVIGTEGATDPEVYQAIVGRAPETIGNPGPVIDERL